MILSLALAAAASLSAQQAIPGRPLSFQPAGRETPAPQDYDDNDGFRLALLKTGDWYSVPSAAQPVLLVVEKGYLDAAALSRVSADAAQAVSQIPDFTGRKPPRYAGRVVVYVYDDGPMSEAGVPGVRAGEQGLMLRFVKEDQAPLFHELTHLLAGFSTASPSLSEGLAELVDAHFRPGKAHAFTPANADPDALARAALAREPDSVIAQVGAPNDGKPFGSVQERHDWYFASWSFVKFLAGRRGLPTVFSVMDAGGRDGDYRAAYGEDLASLREDWKKALAARR